MKDDDPKMKGMRYKRQMGMESGKSSNGNEVLKMR